MTGGFAFLIIAGDGDKHVSYVGQTFIYFIHSCQNSLNTLYNNTTSHKQ